MITQKQPQVLCEKKLKSVSSGVFLTEIGVRRRASGVRKSGFSFFLSPDACRLSPFLYIC
jgi:hypothetical protein